MLIVEWRVELRVRGPVLSRSTKPGEYGVDSPVARDSKGRPMLPGDLIEGKLREAWEDLQGLAGSATLDEIKAWLGRKGGGGESSRKRLSLSDFVCDEKGHGEGDRVRTKRDATTLAAADGMLQVIEVPFAAREEVVFVGSARFVPRPGEDREDVRRKLTAGLAWISQVGAQRTVGFGRTVEVKVVEPARRTPALPSPPTGCRAAIVLRLRDPWLVASHRINANLFESLSFLPGGVLKGCLAELWAHALGKPRIAGADESYDAKRAALGRWFSSARFTHLKPVPVADPDCAFFSLANGSPLARPVEPPLSLVAVGDRLYDVAHLPGPALIDGQAPAFRSDWKKPPSGFVQVFGKDSEREPAREVRVRTAIESRTRRAEEAALFAYEMVLPERHLWAGWIDLPADADGERFFADLRELVADGVVGLGKTKAMADAAILPAAAIHPACGSAVLPPAGPVIVTLQSDALLFAADALKEASTAADLAALYEKTWHELSGGALQLEHYYAKQALRGGEYLWHRYQKPGVYRPYVVTTAGSVFVLTKVAGKEREAEEALHRWASGGLSLPAAVMPPGEAREAWHWCPFAPVDGWGEIAVHLGLHADLAPGPELLTHVQPIEAMEVAS